MYLTLCNSTYLPCYLNSLRNYTAAKPEVTRPTALPLACHESLTIPEPWFQAAVFPPVGFSHLFAQETLSVLRWTEVGQVQPLPPSTTWGHSVLFRKYSLDARSSVLLTELQWDFWRFAKHNRHRCTGEILT